MAVGSHWESPGRADGTELGATDNKVLSLSGWTLQ